MKKHGQENQNNEPDKPASSAGSEENQITIQTQQPGTYHISLVDQSGGVVFETTTQTKGAEIVLDLSGTNLNPGMYLVKLTSEESIKVVKIYKK